MWFVAADGFLHYKDRSFHQCIANLIVGMPKDFYIDYASDQYKYMGPIIKKCETAQSGLANTSHLHPDGMALWEKLLLIPMAHKVWF